MLMNHLQSVNVEQNVTSHSGLCCQFILNDDWPVGQLSQHLFISKVRFLVKFDRGKKRALSD